VAAIVVGLAATGAATGAAGAAAARRAHFSANSSAIRSAYALAVAYWHRTPCAGDVTFNWTDAPGSRIATAYWTSDGSGDPNQFSGCHIVLHRSATSDWPMFCTVVLHEVGHLTGHAHVRDRANVMYPFYVGPRGPCTRTQPASAPAGPAPAETPPASAPPSPPTPSPPSAPAPSSPSGPQPPAPQPPAPQPPAPQQPPQQPNPIQQLLGGI
jgi:hypothetical protein